jgi:4-amino-4-deoxy-L-arabinose transferase-like glycosyltransferase
MPAKSVIPSSRVTQRLALGAILALAIFLHFFRLDQVGFANPYYAATVKSMLTSWHNFFYAAFDPEGFVSVDKPPLGFWVQALSAMIFGFNGLALLLPQALAGVLSVALLYHLVARVFGAWAGVLAALVLTVSPIFIAANRNNTIDSQLVFTSLLAAWAVSLAAERGKLRWLLLCAILVGIGFNIKMLQAYLVLPAFWLMYLIAARTRWYWRVAHLALATIVLVVVSLAWIVIFDLTPATERPYAGSSRNNTMLELAIGHNGITRLGVIASMLGLQNTLTQPHVGQSPANNPQNQPEPAPRNLPPPQNPLPSNPPQLPNTPPNPAPPPSSPPQPNAPRGPNDETGAPGLLRLFNQQLAGQVSWLLPLALFSILVLTIELILASRALRFGVQDSQFEVQGSGFEVQSLTHHVSRFASHALLLWSIWLVPQIVFFSFAGLFHRYYLEMMAPAIAALVGAGVAAMWRDYQQHRWRGFVLPLAILASALAQVGMLTHFPEQARGLTPLILGLAATTALALVVLKFAPTMGRSLRPALATLGVLTLLVTPTVWSLTPLASADAALPFAGPELLSRPPRPPQPMIDNRLIEYCRAHRNGARFLVATINAQTAAPIILATGEAVMTIGGFGGQDPILTLDRFKELIRQNSVRFFLLPGQTNQQMEITRWVTMNCTNVTSAIRANAPRSPTEPLLFDCRK